MSDWLNDLIAFHKKHSNTPILQNDLNKMVNVLIELAGYASDFAIEMGGYHIFKDSYPEASDDAKELIEQLIPKTTIGYWYGRPIEEYTKEELINIVSQLGNEVGTMHKRHIKDLEFLTALSSMEVVSV